MKHMAGPFVLMLALLTAAIFAAARARLELPGEVVSHFDAAGRADGTMARDEFLGWYVALVVGIALLFTFLTWLLPRLPDSLINIPHRDHWLAPERRTESLDRLMGQSLWIACATLVLFMVVFRITWLASLPDGGDPGPWIWIPLALYLATVLGMVRRQALSLRKNGPGRALR